MMAVDRSEELMLGVVATAKEFIVYLSATRRRSKLKTFNGNSKTFEFAVNFEMSTVPSVILKTAHKHLTTV